MPNGPPQWSGQDINSFFGIYILSHHAYPRASLHLKTQKEYFFCDEESIGMLKTGLGGS